MFLVPIVLIPFPLKWNKNIFVEDTILKASLEYLSRCRVQVTDNGGRLKTNVDADLATRTEFRGVPVGNRNENLASEDA